MTAALAACTGNTPKVADVGTQEPATRLATVNSDRELQNRVARASADHVDALPVQSLGYYLDVQTAALQTLAGSGLEVSRRQDHIQLVIPGADSFGSDSVSLTATAQRALDDIAEQLVEFNQSLVAIAGHSDAAGEPAYNRRLSLQRAIAVGNYLAARGVESARLVVRGYGASQPREANTTARGRATNRRIEIALWPLVIPPAGSSAAI